MILLSVVVPAYNASAFMHRCVDSLLTQDHGVEILIVNDGSMDSTDEVADSYASRFPGRVRAIHKPNGGHGSAINAGLSAARGRYFKVVDADDWVEPEAFAELIRTLSGFESGGTCVDMVLSNFVYEKDGRQRRHAVRYRRALPRGRVFGWGEVPRLRKTQYFLMHSIVYRTKLLRDIGLELPEHTFYVDNIFAYMPLPSVETMYYLDVDLYRYWIGREGQSVAESVMISRMEQQLRVNRLMMEHVARKVPSTHPAYRYMTHYLEIVCAVSSTLLLRSGTAESMAAKEVLWRGIREEDELLHRRLRRGLLGQLINLPGRPGRTLTLAAYRAAQWRVGFN